MPSSTDKLFSKISERKYDHMTAAQVKRGMVTLSPEEAKDAAMLAGHHAQHRTLDALHSAYPNAVTREVYEEAIKRSPQKDLLADKMLNEHAKPQSSTTTMFKSFFTGFGQAPLAGSLKIYDDTDKENIARDRAAIKPGETFTALLRNEEGFAGSSTLKTMPYQAPSASEQKPALANTGLNIFRTLAARTMFGIGSPGKSTASLPAQVCTRIPKAL